MNILTENEINIKSLEKNFYDCGCKLAAEAFANTTVFEWVNFLWIST